jgi:hypothetical protein
VGDAVTAVIVEIGGRNDALTELLEGIIDDVLQKVRSVSQGATNDTILANCCSVTCAAMIAFSQGAGLGNEDILTAVREVLEAEAREQKAEAHAAAQEPS